MKSYLSNSRPSRPLILPVGHILPRCGGVGTARGGEGTLRPGFTLIYQSCS